ncbi:MAG: sulfatase-like hydrolase/transferase [Bacteroidales bacterium]
MKYLKNAALSSFFFLFILTSACTRSTTNKEKPNIVVIEIDDLGYGDVGAYNEDIGFTPNIDKLAEEGTLFTDYHSNGPMSSPTRAAFLTGMYQHRLGERFEGALSAKRKDKGLPLNTLTIAELLKEEGYATGKFGKWHLGVEKLYFPINYGFGEFRGLVSGDGDHHTHINRWGRKDWWHNDNINMEKGYSVDLITEHSLNFIEQHKNEPFFMNVSHLAIHFPWQGPEDPPHRKAGKTYEDDKWGIIENRNNVRPHVKSMIKSVDQSVGKIIGKLKELNIEKNTLVIFTSDNGGYIHYDHEFFNISSNGPLRGQKTEVYEGGHRVPFIAYWPGKIEAGTKINETVMTMDLFPTFAELAGVKIPQDKKIDGTNILPVLLEGGTLPERTLYWKIGDEWAVLKGPWKLVKDGDKKALFNLEKDIGENEDLSSQYPDRVKDLTHQYQEWKQEVSSYAERWSD